MKIYGVFSILLLHAVACLTANVPNPDSKMDGQKKEQQKYIIHSDHMPYYLSPMSLTTGELKLFAGHSMQFLKAKCPAASPEALNQISKYVAKLVSKTNPVPERSPVFDSLLNSISNCALRDKIEKKTEKPTFLQTYFFAPYKQIKGFFSKTEVDTTPAPSTPSKSMDETSDAIKEPTSNEESLEKKESEATDQASEEEDDPYYFPFFNGFSFSGEDSFWNPTWFKNMYQGVQDFFERIFYGVPEPEQKDSPAAPAPRVKRDADAPPSEDVKESKVEEPKPEIKKPAPLKPKDRRDMEIFADKVQSKNIRGKVAFLQLMDNVCRLFCAECGDGNQILNLKGASKALLQFIYQDDTGVELAGKHYIDEKLLKALEEC